MSVRSAKKVEPYFSIVIPALNEEKYLPLLLSDLASQLLADFEVIVVDGKSTDKTVVKAREFKTKIPGLLVVKSQKSSVSLQRNLGAKKARGEWLIFMDADNRINKFFLKRVKAKLAKKEIEMFTNWSDVDGSDSGSKLLTDVINIGIEVRKFVHYPAAMGALIGIKRAIFVEVGGFNLQMSYLEDAEFVTKACKKGFKFHIFHSPKYTYSLRRFRKYGLWRAVRKEIQFQLKLLANMEFNDKTDRPMGGNIYRN